MEPKTKLREAVEKTKRDLERITENAKETLQDLRETKDSVVNLARDALPKPIRHRVSRRMNRLFRRRRRR
ncbi:MAG: hypothetical protein ACETV1_00935 [Candidatus Bathyarchaeia archaeon]